MQKCKKSWQEFCKDTQTHLQQHSPHLGAVIVRALMYAIDVRVHFSVQPNLYVFQCMWVWYVLVCVHDVCVCVQVYVCACVCVCVLVCMHVCACVCVCEYVYACNKCMTCSEYIAQIQTPWSSNVHTNIHMNIKNIIPIYKHNTYTPLHIQLHYTGCPKKLKLEYQISLWSVPKYM